jgi:hypothetical protein
MKAVAAALAMTCAACAHNLPDGDVPNQRIGPHQARAYVDMNGAFYPPGWTDEAFIGREAVERRHSMFAALADDPAARARVLEAEERWLADLRAMAQGRRRAFIFLVGFNTSQAKSTPDLEAMRDAIAMGPEDLSVQFFWDGHDARAVVDAARIWFWGSGSSQVAGQRGLRRVINAMGDREVVIVSYSRGASVVLSALSDPAYSRRFRDDTLRLTYLEPPGAAFFRPEPLAPGGPIRVLMLAPAIGEPDFRAPDRVNGDWVFRAFPARLASVRYTVNPGDYVLNKLWIGLADNFNSTALGAYSEGGETLDCRYPFLQGYPVRGRVGHAVPDYLADPAFQDMLRDSGLQPRGGARPAGPAPITPRPGCPTPRRPPPEAP